jgi:phosphate transport system permease protein
MTTSVRADAPVPGTLGLTRRMLSRRAPWALGSGTAVLLAALFALSPLDGYALFTVLFVPAYAALLGAVSARVEGGRRARDRVVTVVVYSCFGLALLPLLSVLGNTLLDGMARLDADFLTHSMRGVSARNPGGGVYHAFIGTLQQVGLAALIAVPIGLFTAIYLVEYGHGRLARAVTFFVDVMSGVPSIVAGLFIFSAFVLAFGFEVAGAFGGLALAILMLPVMTRTSEEMLRLVPNELREGAFALGVPRWRTICKVVVPTALPGIVTGVMLAVARVIGETAPLLLTIGFTNSINFDPFHGAQGSLPVYVFNEWKKGLDHATDRAWAAALALIALVMLLNLIARVIARLNAPARNR